MEWWRQVCGPTESEWTMAREIGYRDNNEAEQQSLDQQDRTGVLRIHSGAVHLATGIMRFH